MMEKNVENYITLLPGEYWKPLDQCDMYSISTHGRLFSWRSKNKTKWHPHGLFKAHKHSLGYLTTVITTEKEYAKPVGIHRLVALNFIPNPDNLPEVHHKDHCKSNNHYLNLQWVTHAQNIQLSFSEGNRKMPSGLKHWNAGRIVSNETKQRMREQKIGVKHPKFKGFYIIDGIKYASANSASKILGIPAITIGRRCKNERFSNYIFDQITV